MIRTEDTTDEGSTNDPYRTLPDGGGVLGWLAHAPYAVRAASEPAPMQFQLQGTGPGTQLGVYFGADRDLYVYQGVGAGSSSVNCSFRLHIGKPGGPVERVNCGVGKIE